MLLSESIQLAVNSLNSGGVIMFPTDTIWSLGCDPWNETAYKRIYDIKKRPVDNPLLLLVPSIEELKYYVPFIHPRVETLLTYHLRPLTLIHPHPRNLPKHVLASDGSIGIRVVPEGVCHDLLVAFGKPLTSTSPNIHGTPTPNSFGSISSDLIAAVDNVIMSEIDAIGESDASVIATYDEDGELSFLRL